MNRIRTLAALAVLVTLVAALAACSEKKPPEQAAVKSKNVLSALRDLDSSYEGKKLEAFLSGVSPDYPDREAFAQSLTAVFAKYETIRFHIQYSRMLIMIDAKGPVRTTFTWDAEWTTAGGAAVKDGGRVTLVFEPHGFKLIAIDGKNPFLAQPGETPGNK